MHEKRGFTLNKVGACHTKTEGEAVQPLIGLFGIAIGRDQRTVGNGMRTVGHTAHQRHIKRTVLVMAAVYTLIHQHQRFFAVLHRHKAVRHVLARIGEQGLGAKGGLTHKPPFAAHGHLQLDCPVNVAHKQVNVDIHVIVVFVYFVFYTRTGVLPFKKGLNTEVYVTVLDHLHALHARKYAVGLFRGRKRLLVGAHALELRRTHRPRVGIVPKHDGAKAVFHVWYTVHGVCFQKPRFGIDLHALSAVVKHKSVAGRCLGCGLKFHKSAVTVQPKGRKGRLKHNALAPIEIEVAFLFYDLIGHRSAVFIQKHNGGVLNLTPVLVGQTELTNHVFPHRMRVGVKYHKGIFALSRHGTAGRERKISTRFQSLYRQQAVVKQPEAVFLAARNRGAGQHVVKLGIQQILHRSMYFLLRVGGKQSLGKSRAQHFFG